MRFANLLEAKSALSNVSFLKVKNELTEYDIIHLHDKFLSTGFHFLEVDNIASGRTIMTSVLKSLNFYHDIAYLGTGQISLGEQYFDLHDVLVKYNYVEEKSLLNFFSDQFYFDFLWIEMSDELLKTHWYSLFEKYLFDFQIHNSIPIVTVL